MIRACVLARELLASADKTGGRGGRGEAGPRGATGERGLSGEAGATIAAWRVDAQNYAVVPVMSDGTEGPAIALLTLQAISRRSWLTSRTCRFQGGRNLIH
jgi:hypothetical protein